MTDYQTFIAAISQYPDGMVRWWVEEVLVRGTVEGGIAGAHVLIGAELKDPLGNPQRTVKGPYPLDALDVLSGQPAADWQAIVGQVIQQQQTTIAELTAMNTTTAAALTAMTAERDTALDQSAQAKTAADATIAKLQQQIATLTTQLAAATRPAAPADAVDGPEATA